QTSLFTFDSYQSFEDRMAGRSDAAIYNRQSLDGVVTEGLNARFRDIFLLKLDAGRIAAGSQAAVILVVSVVLSAFG
ncbi:hypothetical protein HW561_22550, partial [Rhodobacteraceae bacterium B1Z28]|nr:hypothetical protein [Ruegeria haliotis]